MTEPPYFETIDLSLTLESESDFRASVMSRLGAVHGIRRRLEGEQRTELLRSTIRLQRMVAFDIPDDEFRRRTGDALSDLFFGDATMLALFHRTRGAAADRGVPLLVRILATPHKLAALPWELLTDPDTGEPLTLAAGAHVVRLARARTNPVKVTPIPLPLRMLIIPSSPYLNLEDGSEIAFDIQEEKRHLLSYLKPLVERGLIELDLPERPTVADIRQCIARRKTGHHLVHYIGHAAEDALLLEDRQGAQAWVEANRFNELLSAATDLRLVVLAGCHTAQLDASESPDGDGMSIADVCVRDSCHMVIGMQALLSFPTQRLWSRMFYHALAAGRSVTDAVSLARAAVHDDFAVGDGRLNWAVPTITIAGHSPDAILDPAAEGTRPSRVVTSHLLRLDLPEEDREFFGHHVQLRVAVNFLTGLEAPGRPTPRCLWISGISEAKLSPFVSRALDDAGSALSIGLHCSALRLFEDGKPLRNLCGRILERLNAANVSASQRGKLSEREWWERLTQEVAGRPFLLALCDLHRLSAAQLKALAKPLAQLVSRRQTRLVLISSLPYAGQLGAEVDRYVAEVRVLPLIWKEVWLWIRRNRPILARPVGRQEPEPVLRGVFDKTLGDRLDLWGQLAEMVSVQGGLRSERELLEIVERIRKATGAEDLAQSASIRVAVAGIHIKQPDLFAQAITRLAYQHEIYGRVAAVEDLIVSPTAVLIRLPSPFVEGSATTTDIAKWLQSAADLGADIIVADFGADQQSKVLDDYMRVLKSQGILIIAAGSNNLQPIYPGWSSHVLTIGPADEHGQPVGTALWDATCGKPELFASDQIDPVLAGAVKDPGLRGSAMAAFNASFAAILLKILDPSLTAEEITETLLRTARPIQTAAPSSRKQPTAAPTAAAGKIETRTPKLLDVAAAILSVRQELIVSALSRGPLDVREIIAATGLRTPQAQPLLDSLVAEGRLGRISRGERQTYMRVKD